MIIDDSIGISVCEPKSDTAFAYHHVFKTRAGNNFYYAVIPSLSDTCLSYSCVNKSSCSLSTAQSQEQRQTQVTSHEIAETITNPDGTGWYNKETGDEIGDICNGRATEITVGANTWTVQKVYSQNESKATNGDITCVASSKASIEDSNATTLISSVELFWADNSVMASKFITAVSLAGIAAMLYIKLVKKKK